MDEKEERKRLRRERIRRRYDNSPRESTNLSSVDESINKNAKEKSEQQIVDSLARLVKRKKEGLDTVTRFRINVVKCETERRLTEELCREERYLLSQQKKDCDKNDNNTQKELSWESLVNIDNPMELFEAMEKMKSLYNNKFRKSDVVIENLSTKLIEKDEAYLENLRRQNRVITDLQSSMDDTKQDLQVHYYNEMKSIEEALVDDRASRIENQLTTLNELVKNKAKTLEQSLEDLMKRREDKQNITVCNQDNATRAYNDLKSNLYAKVNKLECDLAISRGMYQANSDQIEYNLRAISAKNTESEDKVKKRKKRILMYKEELSKELDQSKASDVQEKRRNDVLDNDCRRLEGQYNNLLSKLHRFEIVEEQKYSAAEAMHQEEMNTLSMRILNAKEKVTSDFSRSLTMSPLNDKVNFESPSKTVESQYLLNQNNMNSDASSSTFWSQLESMFIQYHELLDDRERVLSNVVVMKKENHELQLKLEKLLEEDINSELIVPPLSSYSGFLFSFFYQIFPHLYF